MSLITLSFPRTATLGILAGLLAATGTTFAQSAPANEPQNATPAPRQSSSTQDGWKRFSGGWANQTAGSQRAKAAPAPSPTSATQVAQNPDPNPRATPPNDLPEATANLPADAPAIRADNGSQGVPVSSQLTVQPGTILTVRINQALSSDHNQAGDVFSATLTQPVIVHGIVVAQRGQTVAGRVVEAKKAGRVSGVSQLGIALTSLTLVDGQNVPIESQLLVRKGPTSVGRDAAAVAGTTAFGAAVGAAADWGRGAAIGAGAGAAAGLIGVLLTRGYPTIVYPETLLTFQVNAPVAIDTQYAPQTFRAVDPADYPQAQTQQAPPPPPSPPPPAYPYPYYAYYGAPYYPYYYPYYGYPFYYGPSFSFFYGRGFYGGRRFYGGFRGGFHR